MRPLGLVFRRFLGDRRREETDEKESERAILNRGCDATMYSSLDSF